jgi:hypothetical protein
MSEELKGQDQGQPQGAGASQSQPGSGTQNLSGSQSLTDEALVELPTGEKVTIGQLKKERLMEADYRKKTTELADERRRLQEEKIRLQAYAEASQARPDAGTEEEELAPEEVLVRGLQTAIERQNRLEAIFAKNYLESQIDKLKLKYPEADAEDVFRSCWSNRNAVIEDEMKRSHEKIATKTIKPEKLDAKTIEEIERRGYEKILAQKKAAATGSGGAGSGSGVVNQSKEPPKTYEEAGKSLRAELKALRDAGGEEE